MYNVLLNKVNKESEENKEGEKKSNGVVIDVVPTVIIEVNEEKPVSRRGSLRFRGINLCLNYNGFHLNKKIIA